MTNFVTITNNIPFSIRLNLARVARGLSQADVEAGTGIDRSQISRYENGLPPTKEQAAKLEVFFNIQFDHPKVEEAARILAGLTPDSPDTPPVDARILAEAVAA